MTTFEELLQLAQTIAPSDQSEQRQIHWCEDRRVLGIARQPGGGFELFLCGDELHPASPLVRRHLRFDQWSRQGSERFPANRLVLPSEPHYISIVAFLAEELLRNGVADSMPMGFARSEPLIEMALRRIALGEETILGLLGELRFLEVLLVVADTSGRRALALDAWRGHEHGSKDFVVGRRAVEVKATRGERSIHRINSVMQVDPRRSESGQPMEELSLLSIGFQLDESGGSSDSGFSLPTQVETILRLLGPTTTPSTRNEAQLLFLDKVAKYGSSAEKGYLHDDMQAWSAYQTAWQHRFLRIYDMGDEGVRVLRRSDIQRHGHVHLESVNFEIELPDRVSGDINPQTDLFALARRILS